MKVCGTDVELSISPPRAEIEIKSACGINIFSTALLKSFREAIEELRRSSRVRTVIIRSGHASGFSAGAHMQELRDLDSGKSVAFSLLGQSIFASMSDLPMIFIAAVNGYCIGGGFDLVLACDITFLSQRAYFHHPGASRGFITGFGGNYRFPTSATGKAALRALLLTEKVNRKKAEEIGLSLGHLRWHVGKNMKGNGTALLMARKIAEKLEPLDANTIGVIKKVMRLSRFLPLTERMFIESRLSMLSSLDERTGVTS